VHAFADALFPPLSDPHPTFGEQLWLKFHQVIATYWVIFNWYLTREQPLESDERDNGISGPLTPGSLSFDVISYFQAPDLSAKI
jgi:hypothetical protein